MAELMKHGGRFLYNLLTGQVGDEDTFTLVTIMNRRSSLRGLAAVVIWAFAIIYSSVVMDVDELSSDIKVLIGGRTSPDAKLLSASWFSVVGFNSMQVLILGASAVLLTTRQWLEDDDGSVEGWWRLSNLLVVPGRISADLALFLVSLAASVYSLEAVFMLSNVQPSTDVNKDIDARNLLLRLFVILGAQVLTAVELLRRQGGKGLSSVAALKADQRDDSKDNVAQVATELGLNAKDNGLKIHNFY
jgi:hypothetical protein